MYSRGGLLTTVDPIALTKSTTPAGLGTSYQVFKPTWKVTTPSATAPTWRMYLPGLLAAITPGSFALGAIVDANGLLGLAPAAADVSVGCVTGPGGAGNCNQAFPNASPPDIVTTAGAVIPYFDATPVLTGTQLATSYLGEWQFVLSYGPVGSRLSLPFWIDMRVPRCMLSAVNNPAIYYPDATLCVPADAVTLPTVAASTGAPVVGVHTIPATDPASLPADAADAMQFRRGMFRVTVMNTDTTYAATLAISPLTTASFETWTKQGRGLATGKLDTDGLGVWSLLPTFFTPTTTHVEICMYVGSTPAGKEWVLVASDLNGGTVSLQRVSTGPPDAQGLLCGDAPATYSAFAATLLKTAPY